MKNLLFCIAIFLGLNVQAQIVQAKALGRKTTIGINLSSFVLDANRVETLSPSIILVSPENIFVRDSLKTDFFEFLESEKQLWKYRYLRGFADAYLAKSRNQSLERQIFNFNQEAGDFFFIAEKWNQLLGQSLHQNFVYPASFARYLSKTDEVSLNDIAQKHLVKYCLSLDDIKVDYQNQNYVFSAILSIADSSYKDSLSYQAEVRSQGKDIEAGMHELLNAANFRVFQFLVRDKSYRKIWSLQGQRSAALLANYPHPVSKAHLRVIKKDGWDEDSYYHSITNADETKFLALSILNYERNIAEAIKNALGENPYSEIDLETFIDPQEPNFHGIATIGIEVNGRWHVTQSMGYNIHANTLEEAQKAFLKKVQVLGLFKDGSADYDENYWNIGSFRVVDSNYLFHDLAQIYADDTTQALRKRNNYLPYIGLPLFEVEGQLFSSFFAYQMAGSEWSDKYFYRLFKKIDKYNDTLGIDLKKPKGGTTIHDQNRRHVIIPILVIHEGQEKLIYFYWDQRSEHRLYVWTAIPMIEYDGEITVGKLITTSIKPIYPWNFFFRSVNEKWFWQEKVLKKDAEGNFLYLKQIL